MYALTEDIGTGIRAIVGNGQRLEFPPEDGPMLADLLHDQWPQCAGGCEAREDVCECCNFCPDCGSCEECKDEECPECGTEVPEDDICDDCGHCTDCCACEETA
jgi:hypothetical protein